MCDMKAVIQQPSQTSLNQVVLAVASQIHHDPKSLLTLCLSVFSRPLLQLYEGSEKSKWDNNMTIS